MTRFSTAGPLRFTLWLGMVALLCGLAAFPLYWMVVTALQTGRDLFLWPPNLLPNPQRLDVFRRLFSTQPILRWLLNSVGVAGTSALVAVILAAPAAYTLSRFRRPGWSAFSFMLLLTQMLPGAMIIAPLFILFKRLGLLDHLLSLVVINVAFNGPIVLWILKGFIDTIPHEIEEAALIDGCTTTGAFVRIALPLSLPAVAGAFTVAFFEAWNEYLYALTMVSDRSHWVASVGVASWIGELTTPTEVMMAGAVVFALPSVLLFMYLQRYLVVGASGLGAIK